MTERWMTEWLEKLESGDFTGLRVYNAFATCNGEMIKRAGEAIARQLKKLQRPKLLKLCEQFRELTSMEWTIDWEEVSLETVRKELPEEEYKYVLILGTFHPNGYFRERCMYEMAEHDGMLFWLFFRVNDWVGNIRTRACGLLEEYLRKVNAKELFEGIPAMERLQNCQRRSEEQMQKLWDEIEKRISASLKEMELSEISDPQTDPLTRRALYRVLVKSGTLTLEETDTLLRREKIPFLKKILAGGILARPDCTVEWTERYLTDSSAALRRIAVEKKYEYIKNDWPGLEEMLLDSSKGVREYAAYILRRHSSFNIREYYLSHLEDDKPEYAIMGLAESCRHGNLQELMKCMERPERKVLKCTLLALGYQEDFRDEELLWQYLLDAGNELSKAAYLSIRRREFYPGAERIYKAYTEVEEDHRKRYLLNLLLRESSWNRLPCLIRIYRQDMPEEEARKILCGIRIRFMYGKLSRSLQKDILQALEENGKELPEGVEKSILYDMKYLCP